MIELPLNSRYKNAQDIKFNDVETLGMWPGYDWVNSQPSQIVVVKPSWAGRLDLISTEFFGVPDYWWTIMYYNGSTDLNFPRAGAEIKIPNLSKVLSKT